jgi:hypothetical protein
VSWNQAKCASEASEDVKAICCGDPKCFDGMGCDTAKWITRRIESAGYRLVKNPVAIDKQNPPTV